MILEPCPYCGKPFKRLQTHISHCKLSPFTKPPKSSNVPKEMPASPSQKITTINQTNKMNHVKKQKDASTVQKYKVKKSKALSERKTLTTVQETVTEDPPTEKITTDVAKPKMKWLAKREGEMLKQANVLTWKEITSKSISKQEAHNRNTGHIPEKVTVQLNSAITTKMTPNIKTTIPVLQRVSYTGNFWTNSSTPTPEINTDICNYEQIQLIPKHFTKDFSLTRNKEQTDVTFKQVKTSVWDHIKYGLYDKRSSCAPRHQVYRWTNKLCRSENNENASSSSQVLANFQTSSQRAAEPILISQLQNMKFRGYTPDMATGYGALFRSPHSEVSYDDELLTQRQSSKSSPLSQDCIKRQNLGDVSLRETAVWLGSRAPTSPRQAVTMLSKGWHWYYRKYIDVQRGGISGIAMLVAGYCVLSYIWSYPHLKKERWRKYH